MGVNRSSGASSKYLWFVGRLFVATALPFAVLASAAVVATHMTVAPIDLSRGLPLAVAAGVLFGILIAGVLGAAHMVTTGKLMRGPGRLSVQQACELLFDGPTDRAIDLCATAVNRLGKGRVLRVDPQARRIVAVKGMTWRSFGDAIRFEILPGIGSGHVIRVSSRPKLRTTLVDYGSSLINISVLRAYLVANGARPSPQTTQR